MDEVSTYLAAWRETTDRLLALCLNIDDADWDRPTDLPGWRVRDVLAHLAHVESLIVEGRAGQVQRGGRDVSPEWTSVGVEERRDSTPDALRAELTTAVLRRSGDLKDRGEIIGSEKPEVVPAGLDWDWSTLLRNRAIDVWVHEQDIRRAIDRPGGMSGVSAEVAVETFASALPYVLGKKVAPPPGTTVAWRVDGPVPVRRVLRVDRNRRATQVDRLPSDGVTVLSMDTETFAVLSAGRRGWDDVEVGVEGNHQLAERVAAAMGVTP